MQLPGRIDIARIVRAWMTIAQSERHREIASVLFILALASVMLFPVFLGDWPIGHDHPVHIFRIWQLREQLLNHFSPWGWSHRWFAGYPENVIYPIGADLFVLGIQALSFGLLSLGNAYAVAIWLAYFSYGNATYYFVRRAFQSRAAALSAVVFLLTDAGNPEIGGWFWFVDLGVWASMLGFVPALIATEQIATLFESPMPRRTAVVAACIGLALLCHPLFFIYFGVAVPLLYLSRYLCSEQTNWSQSSLLLGVPIGIGLLIAGFWLVPYFMALPYAGEIGSEGWSLSQMGGDFLAGTLFERMHPIPTAFGFVGAVCLLRARRALPLFMSMFVLVIIVIASSEFASLFGPSATKWLEKHIIALRLLMLAKPFLCGATGFLLIICWHASGGIRDFFRTPQLASARKAVMAIFLAAIAAPVLFYALAAFWEWQVRRPIMWHSQRSDLQARADFVTWTKSELSRDKRFFRIAHGFDTDEHDLTDLAMEVPYPFYKIGHTPTGHFKYEVCSSDPIAFCAFNVRFALSHVPLARDDLRLVKAFDERLLLYEFYDWNPMPFEIFGMGDVELMEFSDEKIVLRASEHASGQLRLNVTYYPNWRATRDGGAVPITAVPVPEVERSAVMQIPLAPGTYSFVYEHGVSDYAGIVLSVLGLIACGALAKSKRVGSSLQF